MVQDLRVFAGNTDVQSRGAVVFNTLLQVSLKNFVLELFPEHIFGPTLGRDLFVSYTRDVISSSRILALVGQLKAPQAPFFGATGASDAVQARNASVIRSLREADSLLVGQLGPDTVFWNWGSVHVLLSTHPLSRFIPTFAFPPASFGGDSTTLSFGGFFNGGTPFSKGAQLLVLPPEQLFQQGGLFAVFFPESTAAERIAWNVGNPLDDRGILSTGQSGNPNSPHWADMRPLFVDGQYVAF
jgi:penicillin amidase